MMFETPEKVILITGNLDATDKLINAINQDSGIELFEHWRLPLSSSQTIDPYNTVFLFAGDLGDAAEIPTLAKQIPTLLITLDGQGQLSLNDFVQQGFVGCLDLKDISSLKSVLKQCLLHFEAQGLLKKELQDVQSRLEDRKQIERAKGILMSTHQYNESEAYVFLRKLSMDRAQRMGDVAKQILSELPLASK